MRSYTLETFDHPVTWGGQPLPKEDCHKLRIGDVVRLILIFSEKERQSFYFIITKVDHYRYGGINKIRKYHGKVFDIYNPSWKNIPKDHTTTWRREHIMEIPGWNECENDLHQANYDLVSDYRKKMAIDADKMWIHEHDKKALKELEFKQLVKDCILTYGFKGTPHRLIAEEFGFNTIDDIKKLYVIGNISKEKIRNTFIHMKSQNLQRNYGCDSERKLES